MTHHIKSDHKAKGPDVRTEAQTPTRFSQAT